MSLSNVHVWMNVCLLQSPSHTYSRRPKIPAVFEHRWMMSLQKNRYCSRCLALASPSQTAAAAGGVTVALFGLRAPSPRAHGVLTLWPRTHELDARPRHTSTFLFDTTCLAGSGCAVIVIHRHHSTIIIRQIIRDVVSVSRLNVSVSGWKVWCTSLQIVIVTKGQTSSWWYQTHNKFGDTSLLNSFSQWPHKFDFF